MKHSAFRKVALFLLLALLLPALVRAEDISGKWTRDATIDNGGVHHWTLDIKKDKFTFRVVDADKKTVLYAKGDVKVEKLGDFTTATFSNIQAGITDDNLNPVEDDRHCVYTLDGNTLKMAMNFDKDRENGPRIDVYTKSVQ